MSDNQIMGGVRALWGFYYQIIASLNLAVLDIYRFSNTVPTETDSDGMLSFVSSEDASYYSEFLGQDLFIDSGNHKILVQFKYSQEPDNHQIQPHDLKDILLSFVSSLDATAVKGIKQDTITDYLLITNKPLSPESKSILDAVKKCRSDNSILENSVNHLILDTTVMSEYRFKYKGKSSTLGDIASEWTEADEKRKSILYVLSRFYVNENAQITSFEKHFIDLSNSYGVFPDEMEKALEQLNSKILMSSLSSPFPLKEYHIIEALTGSSAGRPLTLNVIGPSCKKSLDKWAVQQRSKKSLEINRNLSKVLDAFEDSKIVILSGLGGCGKTVSLIQFMEAISESATDNSMFQGFPLAISARRLIDENWIGNEVGSWANRNLSTKDVLKRLRLANPNKNHMLYLAIDGLDEGAPARSIMNKILTLVKETSNKDIRLLVTCRSSEIKNIKNLYFDENATGSNIETPIVRDVFLSKFDQDELCEAVRIALGDEYADRFIGDEYGSSRLPGRLVERKMIDKEILDSLAHPRMLGAWAIFRDEKEIIEGALEGGKDELRKIAREYLKLFFIKYMHRWGTSQGFVLREHAKVYAAIATQTYSQKKRMFYNQHWKVDVNLCYIPRETDIRKLFNEGDAGGLIIVEGHQDEWWWRHPYVAECLVQDNPEEYLPS